METVPDRSGGPPGREKLAAALGELLVLRDVVRADRSHRVDSWVGPFGGRHDFRRGAVALEVKITRSHTSRDVTIHGEDQLDPPPNGSLHLHFVRLEEVPSGGESVATLVDELLSGGVVADRLFEALAATGVPPAELSATGDVSFEVRERLTVPIDDQTPRIVPASFIGGAPPTGVLDLSYVISIDHALDPGIGPSGLPQTGRRPGGSRLKWRSWPDTPSHTARPAGWRPRAYSTSSGDLTSSRSKCWFVRRYRIAGTPNGTRRSASQWRSEERRSVTGRSPSVGRAVG